MIINDIWKSALVLAELPKACERCGSSFDELGTQYASVLASVPKENPFYGKVPYQCRKVECGQVIYAPSLRNQKARCCF